MPEQVLCGRVDFTQRLAHGHAKVRMKRSDREPHGLNGAVMPSGTGMFVATLNKPAQRVVQFRGGR